MSDKLSDFKTDYLFLLVGTNPLPNYVAALLLAKDNSKIFLLHTGGTEGTLITAQRLKAIIKNKISEAEVSFKEIDDSDGQKISTKVQEILKETRSNKSIGLHYTGGTKAMSVYTYHVMKQHKDSHKVFSYLDARTFVLLFESNIESVKHLFVGDKIKVDLKTMMDLHGYKAKDKKDIKITDIHLQLYKILANELQEKNVHAEWVDWINNSKCEIIPELTLYPSLTNIRNEIDAICEREATPELLARMLNRFPYLKSYSKWFNGDWLEEYVFWAVNEIAAEVGIHALELSLETEPVRIFEIDVAAVKGYQLFAISCISSSKKANCKEHLLEVYVRARQIGGDEARIGLVSLYKDYSVLQQEIDESWFGQGKVRVFDPKDLCNAENLKNSLKEWFSTVNQ